MITVEQALQLVLSRTLPKETERIDLHLSVGRVLAETIRADRDAPPFDRVAMDGIALQAEALQRQEAFKIENIQAAGAPQAVLNDPANCIEVMTGAVLPAHTDCVIPYEQIELRDGYAFPLSKEHIAGQNVHPQGKDAKRGEEILAYGKVISPAVVAVLASVGRAQVAVMKPPTIAICSTGDELVDVADTPLPHQIRKSNAAMIQASLLEFGLQPALFHLPDNKEQMVKQLSAMVKSYSVLLFSGAVSKGRYDFLPEVLTALGMEKHFHGVAQRPGKPFLFGTLRDSLIFGFPGNPVSTFVCFQRFFIPWLKQQMGMANPSLSAVLGTQVQFRPSLTYHLLVRLEVIEGRLTALPVAHSGSGDLVHLAEADAVMSLPAEKEYFDAGEVYPLKLIKKDLFY